MKPDPAFVAIAPDNFPGYFGVLGELQQHCCPEARSLTIRPDLASGAGEIQHSDLRIRIGSASDGLQVEAFPILLAVIQ